MKLIQTLVLIFIANLLFSQAGNLDLTFGDEGKMITGFDQLSAEANEIALQSDGKIILSGIAESDSDEDIIAVRYLQNGQLDTSFGINGKFILSISDVRDRCFDVEVDNLNNIYLTGVTLSEDFDHLGFIVKLNADGEIDSSFAQNGIWLSDTDFTDSREVLIQEDGKIIISGKNEDFWNATTSTLVRLNPNGAIDSSFGENGIATAEVPHSYNPIFAKINSNGEIIAGGFFFENSANIILIKFNQHGEVDSTFGTDGVMLEYTPLFEFARDIVIQKNNKILVATGVTNPSSGDFGLVRYTQDGTLDNGFGDNGKISTDFFQSKNTPHAIVIQEDGKIILSGFIGITPHHDYALARYDTLGNLDPSFGNGGKVITDFGYEDLAFASAIQSDGKLICAGYSQTTENNSSFSIARYFTQTETNTTDISRNINSVKIFPNPSNGNFKLSIDLNVSKQISISLLNLDGKFIQPIVTNSQYTEGENTIEVEVNEKHGTGFYLVRIQTDKGSVNRKVFIKR